MVNTSPIESHHILVYKITAEFQNVKGSNRGNRLSVHKPWAVTVVLPHVITWSHALLGGKYCQPSSKMMSHNDLHTRSASNFPEELVSKSPSSSETCMHFMAGKVSCQFQELQVPIQTNVHCYWSLRDKLTSAENSPMPVSRSRKNKLLWKGFMTGSYDMHVYTLVFALLLFYVQSVQGTPYDASYHKSPPNCNWHIVCCLATNVPKLLNQAGSYCRHHYKLSPLKYRVSQDDPFVVFYVHAEITKVLE